MMTLVELKYLVALAETKHFGKAAAHCHVSQPTLSVAINKLEKNLGVSIFERHQNGIYITEIGEKLIMQAQRILVEAAHFHQIANASKCQLNSPLKIGAIYTVAPYIFPALIPQLQKLAPDMPLIIHEDFTTNLRVKLQRGELDVIFIALPFKEPSVVVKPIYDESFVVLLPKAHPLSKNQQISNTDLNKERLLLLGEGHCFRDQILATYPQYHQSDKLQQTIEGTSLETLRHMVASGMGITILPSTATQVNQYSETLCTKPFKSKAPSRTVALAWRASFPRSKAIDTLINALHKTKLSSICPIN